jgi:hypothetical protein
MNMRFQKGFLLVTLVVLLGFTCVGAGEAADSSAAATQPKKTNPPQAPRPTRAEALARIVRLGGRSCSPRASIKEPVVVISQSDPFIGLGNPKLFQSNRSTYTAFLRLIMDMPAGGGGKITGDGLKRLTDADLRLLTALPELRWLDLSGTKITDAGLKNLTDANHSPQGAQMQLCWLDLSGTKITDAGLKHTAALKGLEHLKLDKTSVSIAGLLHLKNLKHLRAIHVANTKVRESDIARFKGGRKYRTFPPFSQNVVRAWLVGEAPESSAWATSDDNELSLRIMAPKKRFGLSERVVLLAELRNNTKYDLVVCRPFDDIQGSVSNLLAIDGPKGRVAYTGFNAHYLPDKNSTLILRPGEIIRDRIELPTSYSKFDIEGQYSFRFLYRMGAAAHGSATARRFPATKRWAGGILSKELKITKSPKKPPVATQPKKTNPPQTSRPTRAEALARIAELGGKSRPSRAATKEPVLIISQSDLFTGLRNRKIRESNRYRYNAFIELKFAAWVLTREMIAGDGLKRLTDSDLRLLAALPELRWLDLSGTNITDAGLKNLTDANHRPHGTQPQVWWLDLSGTKITDAGLKHVAALKGLEHLNLDKTSVSIAGLLHLKNLKHLKALYVADTEVKESDIARFKGRKKYLAFRPFSRNAVNAWLIGEELKSSPWATSEDKALSLRILAPKRPLGLSEPVVLLAELRNNTKHKLVVPRPFGDREAAVRHFLIHGPKGRVAYTGPIVCYMSRRDSAMLVGPAEITRDRIELPASYRQFDIAGQYSFRFLYGMRFATSGCMVGRRFSNSRRWIGRVISKELKITRSPKKPPAATQPGKRGRD